MAVTMKSVFSSIEEVVESGKAVISADDSSIIALVQDAIKSGRSMTFYVPRKLARAILQWYWTPERIRKTGLQLVSEEEMARIESELHIKERGAFYSNRITCPSCGHVYGGFEFLQQGLREHPRDMVEAILSFENTSVLRVNTHLPTICPECDHQIPVDAGGGSIHYYGWGESTYGCCREDD